jgi:hypothetical protein
MRLDPDTFDLVTRAFMHKREFLTWRVSVAHRTCARRPPCGGELDAAARATI